MRKQQYCQICGFDCFLGQKQKDFEDYGGEGPLLWDKDKFRHYNVYLFLQNLEIFLILYSF